MLTDKKKKFFIVNLLIIGLIGMMLTNGAIKAMGTAVHPGDEFTYVMNKFEVSSVFGETEDSFTTYKIGDNEFTPGPDSVITVTVLETSESFFGASVVYEIKKDSSTMNGTSNVITVAFLPLTALFPFLYIGLVQGEAANLSISNNGHILPFVLPIANATDPAWASLKEGFANQTVSLTTDDSDFSYSISNVEKDGNLHSEASFNGIIKNATTNEDLTLDSEILLIYKLSTGVLQGARFNIDGSGTVDDKSFNVKYDIEFFLEGFDLPVKAAFGFEITTTFVGLLFVISYAVKKRRN
ncbi:MAG: choice-of-anchor S family protein [Candidatus Hodarchaeales archaeon]|jgi:hypothetical protein